jgi:DNA-binding NarL/FixJ family response regulator
MNKLKVLLADDHDSFRRVLVSFLRSHQGIEIVGEAVDGNEAVIKTGQLQPDIVLMDVHMPHRNGIEATRAIKRLSPNTIVIIMSMDPSESYRRNACMVADGYVPKTSIKKDLFLAFESLSYGLYNNVAVV